MCRAGKPRGIENSRGAYKSQKYLRDNVGLTRTRTLKTRICSKICVQGTGFITKNNEGFALDLSHIYDKVVQQSLNE